MERESTARGVIAEDCYWRVAKMLHVAGELQAASALDAMLWNGQVRGENNRHVLANTVGAAQRALANVTHDAGRSRAALRAAYRACQLAWRLRPGDEPTNNLFEAVKADMRRAGIDYDQL
jgi:hypothetical protein